VQLDPRWIGSSDGVVRPLLYEGGVVHGLPRHHVLALLPAEEPGGVPHRGAPRRHVDEHHGPCSNLTTRTDPHVTQDGSAGADEHAVPDLGVAVAHRLARPSERDVVQDGDVVAHDGGLADDDPRGVVEEHALAERRGGVDVDGEDLGDARLQRERKRAAALRPQHVRDAVRLHGEEALVVEQAVREARARGVAGPRRDEVGDRGREERRVGGEGGHEEVVEQRGQQRRGAELVGQVEGQRAGEGRVREHGREEEGGQHGFGLRVAAGLGFDLGPDPRLVGLGFRGRVRRHHRRVERRRAAPARELGRWLGAERLPGRHRASVCVDGG
jgi:hypothetical protein